MSRTYKIKPLEWKQVNNLRYAENIIGYFHTFFTMEKSYRCFYQYHFNGDYFEQFEVETLKQAKKKLQEKYEEALEVILEETHK